MKLKISVFFQSPCNVFLFRHMSPRVAQHYLHAIGFLYYLVNRGEKRVIEKNVRDVLAGQDERYIRRVVRETFKGIFTHYFEKMFSAYLDYGTVRSYVDEHFTVEGAELLDKALEQGKGCILVTAHWGAVEFIPWVLHMQGVPLQHHPGVRHGASWPGAWRRRSLTGDTELISSELRRVRLPPRHAVPEGQPGAHDPVRRGGRVAPAQGARPSASSARSCSSTAPSTSSPTARARPWWRPS